MRSATGVVVRTSTTRPTTGGSSPGSAVGRACTTITTPIRARPSSVAGAGNSIPPGWSSACWPPCAWPSSSRPRWRERGPRWPPSPLPARYRRGRQVDPPGGSATCPRREPPAQDQLRQDRRVRQSDRAGPQGAEEADAGRRCLQGDEAPGALRETVRTTEAQAGGGSEEAPQGAQTLGNRRLARQMSNGLQAARLALADIDGFSEP